MISKKSSAMMLMFVTVLMIAACAHTGTESASTSSTRSVKTTAEDMTITGKVKAKLAEEKLGTLTHVNVDTMNGIVYLNGTVANPTLKARATEIARGVDGVREVVNNLQVSAG